MDSNIYISSGKNFGANKGGSDDWYTPRNAIELLLPFIKPGSTIWCPFDTEDSNYVRVLSKDHIVLYSHISQPNGDFFSIDVPDNVDYIISNPPYSRRTEILKRLYEIGKPFAMMCNSNGIFDNKVRWSCAKDFGVELLFMSPRVKFSKEQNLDVETAPPYQSCYWCYKMLPERLVFTNLL